MTKNQTPWEKFKKKYDVLPWDLVNPKSEKVSDEVSSQRMETCNSCSSLVQTLRICRHCGCYMPAKTTLAEAECPIGKWKKEERQSNE
jgi:hypothetical protein